MNLLAIDPVAFSIFGWDVYWYGVIIGVAMLLGLGLASREMKKHGFDEDFILDLMIWVIPIGFLGARLYYVIFEWEYYLQNPMEIWQIWNGGIAIYGGLIAGGLTMWWYSRHRHMPTLFVLDVVTPYVLLAQGIGRWGNFINQEAHGDVVSESFLRDTLHLPNFIVEGMNVDGTYYEPTFLYESVWNIIGVVLLLILRGRDKTLKMGEAALLYVMWYSFGRFFIEGLRTDSLYWGSFRVSQVLAAILFVGALAIFIWNRVVKRDLKQPYYSEVTPKTVPAILYGKKK